MELMKGRLVDYAKCEISLHFCKSGRKTGGLLAKCEISLHFCKSGRKTGGLLAKCEISLYFCK